MNDLRMNLKVCEGCGALWLRAEQTTGAYCRRCAERLAQFPAPIRKKKRGKRAQCGGAR